MNQSIRDLKIKECKHCEVILIPDENWSGDNVIHYRYVCDTCYNTPCGTQFSEAQIEQIKQLFNRGGGTGRIAEKMGVGRMVMRKTFDDLGLKRQQNIKVEKFEEEQRC